MRVTAVHSERASQLLDGSRGTESHGGENQACAKIDHPFIHFNIFSVIVTGIPRSTPRLLLHIVNFFFYNTVFYNELSTRLMLTRVHLFKSPGKTTRGTDE